MNKHANDWPVYLSNNESDYLSNNEHLSQQNHNAIHTIHYYLITYVLYPLSLSLLSTLRLHHGRHF
jgi:hypothetical protein